MTVLHFGTALFLLAVAGCSARREPAPSRLPAPTVVPAPATVPVVVTLPVIVSPPRPEAPAPLALAEGEATYYASHFEGRKTASGIPFSNEEYYAAHRTYPFGTMLRVTNLANQRSVLVRVVDRGPNGSSERARATIVDVSQRAAAELDFIRAGRIRVRVEVLEWGS